MTREERSDILREKADALAKWFEGRELPPSPLKLNRWALILDVEKYIDVQRERLERLKKDPFNCVYIGSYYLLFDLKKYIENEFKPDNSEAGKL